MTKKTLIIGASENPERYSYKAIHSLVNHNQPIVAIGLKSGNVAGVSFDSEKTHFDNIHTISLYVSAKNQSEYYSYIINLRPKRVIFNPGTENETLKKMLDDNGIEAIEACTLVMLSTNQF